MEFAVPSFAQQRAMASVATTIVTPIGVTNNTDSVLGNNGINNGAVVLTPVTMNNLPEENKIAITQEGSVVSASYTVKDQGAFTYSITLPTTVNTGTATLAVFTSTGTTTGKGVLAKSTATLNIGVALKKTGDNSSGIIIPITVNYN
jgi:hypothetical protein